MTIKKTVFVGLSGGVDSSVAALRLKKQGYSVVGVFIKVWQPNFLNCNWEQERLDAMRVAAHLEIPFLTCDAEEAYRTEVGEFFVSEYIAGRTPNPDVMCNQYVKFGAFLAFAKKHGADFIATGHYAKRLENSESDTGLELHRGVDSNKDQSYFLWTLTKAQLESVLLPIGDTPKEVIRKEAAAATIPTATKKDSQGICFLGHIDIAEFLSHFTKLMPGQVLSETGEVLGEHKGALIYTVGQRHGFMLHSENTERKPYYVTNKDLIQNTITVSAAAPVLATSDIVTLVNCNWINQPVKSGSTYEAQFRYRQKPFSVRITKVHKDVCTLSLQESTDAVAIGQSCVLYRGSECLGGGIIA